MMKIGRVNDCGKKSTYIGLKSDPGKAKVNSVVQALEYAQKRSDHYDKSIDDLFSLLPTDLRKQYGAKEVDRPRNGISKLQSEKQRKTKSRGRQ